MASILRFLRPAQPAPAPVDPEAREAELLARARGGDIDAWSQLYREHYDRVFRHLAYLTGDVQAAEDLVQETFASAFVSLKQFEGRSSLTGWLRGIALNLVRHRWRSLRRGDLAMDRLAAGSTELGVGADANPEGAHLRQRRAEVLLKVLETLPPQLREAFVLCDLQDMSAQAAGAELGISPGNVRVRATRARARIRAELVRLGWLEGDDEARDDEA
ncbi:RNA polymerase sigma factor [Nannocystis radixulma]|uniref:RNA polymerase sigma factor n=1 Tax=Nannocystis radixulma TaxID=2995305 RepID=A0ABT5B442_9BACT|nr:RNA polymerase sigma factor [Nannocystis radixulma]MDC0667836.1 RNA polymerase sigma factor [Nannocystis radixulma]